MIIKHGIPFHYVVAVLKWLACGCVQWSINKKACGPSEKPD